MSAFLADLYISRTSTPDIMTKDPLNCTLEMDTSIRVSHEHKPNYS